MTKVNSRFLLLACDAAMTAPLRSRQSIRKHIQLLLNVRTREFDKVPSVINLVDRLIPGVAKRLSESLYQSAHLPLAHTQVQLINYGFGATVFFLETPGGDKVLKIYRRSLGTKLNRGLEILNEYKSKYEVISAWYKGEYELFPRAQFLMLNGPLLKHPVGAILQTYVRGVQRDLFNDFSNEELVCLIKNDAYLHGQFCLFTSRTLALFSEKQVLIDILGANNVALVHHDDIWRLALMDGGILDLASLQRDRPHVYAEIQARMARIKSLYHAICGVGFE